MESVTWGAKVAVLEGQKVAEGPRRRICSPINLLLKLGVLRLEATQTASHSPNPFSALACHSPQREFSQL